MKFALCNEVLQPLPFARQCELAAQLGYDGLEVAPFTLADDPTAITDAQASELRRVAEGAGVTITGLHWLLVAPGGLSITSADAGVRARTAAVMDRLVGLCAQLGGRYLVHGSPKQREVSAGDSIAAARSRAIECFARAARRAEACGVAYCIEPLAPRETDFVNTVEEAVALVDEIGSPALKTMIDCSAAGLAETLPVDALMERWIPTGRIAHVQVNDPNRRGPGQGAMAFAPIVATLLRLQAAGHYRGIVAVEPFDYVPDGPGSAARAIGYMRGLVESFEARPT